MINFSIAEGYNLASSKINSFKNNALDVGDLNLNTHHLLPKDTVITDTIINSAMPDLNESQLGKILTRFYKKSLGGREYWDKINSIKFSGELNTNKGTFDYLSIVKKPNFYKISISSAKSTTIVAFDGKDKWRKQIAGEEESPAEMVPEMHRMLHEPELLLHLLYPLKNGKSFKYQGTQRKFNTVCFKISLLIEEGYSIDYYIDTESYLIVAAEITDMLSDFYPVLIAYSNYKTLNSLYFAHTIKFYMRDRLESTLNINNVSTNSGAVRWLFDLNR